MGDRAEYVPVVWSRRPAERQPHTEIQSEPVRRLVAETRWALSNIAQGDSAMGDLNKAQEARPSIRSADRRTLTLHQMLRSATKTTVIQAFGQMDPMSANRLPKDQGEHARRQVH